MVSGSWSDQHHLKQVALSDHQFTQGGVSLCHLKGMFSQSRSSKLFTALECTVLHSHLATSHLCSWRLRTYEALIPFGCSGWGSIGA